MIRIRLVLFALACLCAAASRAAETRIALVIGNSAYTGGALPNPANDAKMIGDTLKSLGFEVIPRTDADQTTMKRAIQEFGARLEKAGHSAVGLFYYAGHGLQLNGKNYLIPTTARIEREGDVDIESVSTDWVIEQMTYARNRLNIVILDACRNNPFIHNNRSLGGNGLAVIQAPTDGSGMIIEYSTAPGSVATDGKGRDSPYAEALNRAMRDLREQPVELVFKHVRVEVMDATSGNQVPWEASSLTGDFYFSPQSAAPKPAIAVDTTPSARPQVAESGNEPTRSSGGFGSWVSGLFGSNKSPDAPPASSKPAAAAASGGAAAASPPLAPAPKPANVTVASAGATIAGARAMPIFKTLGVQVADIDAGNSYPSAAIRALIEKNPRHVTLGNTPQQMQAGFAMCQKYSPLPCKVSDFSDEILRDATLEPFDIDTVPVSVQAFRRFVDATHYRTEAEIVGYAFAGVSSPQKIPGGNWRNAVLQHPVSDDAAVVGVTFQDASMYCRYKNQRLPTENEWEYVARGPDRHTFPWGETVAPATLSAKLPPHVGDGPAQGIGGRYRGLSANVWQWVDSSYSKYKILKGGSWVDPNPADKRAAARLYQPASGATDDSGFRCARSLAAWPDTEIWMAQLK